MRNAEPKPTRASVPLTLVPDQGPSNGPTPQQNRDALIARLRTATRKCQDHVDGLQPYFDEILAVQTQLLQEFNAHYASIPRPVFSELLARLTGLRMHVNSDGKIRAPGVLLESPYEMRFAMRDDFLTHLDNFLVQVQQALDQPPPPQAA